MDNATATLVWWARMAEIDASASHQEGTGTLLDRDTFGGRIAYGTFARILQR